MYVYNYKLSRLHKSSPITTPFGSNYLNCRLMYTRFWHERVRGPWASRRIDQNNGHRLVLCASVTGFGWVDPWLWVMGRPNRSTRISRASVSQGSGHHDPAIPGVASGDVKPRGPSVCRSCPQVQVVHTELVQGRVSHGFRTPSDDVSR